MNLKERLLWSLGTLVLSQMWLFTSTEQISSCGAALCLTYARVSLNIWMTHTLCKLKIETFLFCFVIIDCWTTIHSDVLISIFILEWKFVNNVIVLLTGHSNNTWHSRGSVSQIEEGYFEYGNFKFENCNFEKQSGELKAKLT